MVRGVGKGLFFSMWDCCNESRHNDGWGQVHVFTVENEHVASLALQILIVCL